MVGYAFGLLFLKQLRESVWLLTLSALALFALSWTTVYVTARIERRFQAANSEPRDQARRAGFLRGMGGSAMDFSTAAIEMAWWNHPFIVLVVAVWAVARGSGAVAADLERGTMDLVLSRPIPRWAYLAAQVSLAGYGLIVLSAAMVLGNMTGTQFNRVSGPPGALVLSRPALNLACLGLAIYGITFLFSTLDRVRWRPNMIGSVLTLASYVLVVIVNAPTLEDWKWLEQFSVFKAYNPVEAAVKGETLAFNATALTLVGAFGIVAGFTAFRMRDLPAAG